MITAFRMVEVFCLACSFGDRRQTLPHDWPGSKLRPLVLVILVLATITIARESARAQEPASAEPDKQLKERDRLLSDSERLEQEGKLHEAFSAAQRAYALEKDLFGGSNEKSLATLDCLANLAVKREQFAAAREYRQKSLEVATEHYDKNDYDVTDARLAFAQTETLAKLTPDERERLKTAEEKYSEVL